ncbi:hypothetical protein L1887_56410 [Cichorium endivia]|nr:hypothetical protein L1887_56410 [Cichorium endivia]
MADAQPRILAPYTALNFWQGPMIQAGMVVPWYLTDACLFASAKHDWSIPESYIWRWTKPPEFKHSLSFSRTRHLKSVATHLIFPKDPTYMAPFNSSEHAPAVFDNADDSRMLTILYGTLGTSIALIGLIVTTLAFLRSCRLWRGTSQLGDSAEVELRDTMARDALRAVKEMLTVANSNGQIAPAVPTRDGNPTRPVLDSHAKPDPTVLTLMSSFLVSFHVQFLDRMALNMFAPGFVEPLSHVLLSRNESWKHFLGRPESDT